MNKLISLIKKEWQAFVGVMTGFLIAISQINLTYMLLPRFGFMKALIITTAVLIPVSFVWTMILFIQWTIKEWIDWKDMKRRKRNRCINCGVPYNTSHVF